MLTTQDRCSALRRAKTPFAEAILICGKCVRKLGPEGKAVRKRLRKALERRPGETVRLIETRCFSLCPKGRIVLASARTLGERSLMVADPDITAPAALAALLAADLFPEQ